MGGGGAATSRQASSAVIPHLPRKQPPAGRPKDPRVLPPPSSSGSDSDLRLLSPHFPNSRSKELGLPMTKSSSQGGVRTAGLAWGPLGPSRKWMEVVGKVLSSLSLFPSQSKEAEAPRPGPAYRRKALTTACKPALRCSPATPPCPLEAPGVPAFFMPLLLPLSQLALGVTRGWQSPSLVTP